MSDLEQAGDFELLQRIRGGDRGAFSTLYRRRQGAIYRFALQMSGSEAVAEDVTQEVFLALMRDSGRYDPARGPLAAFLYGMARHFVWKALDRMEPAIPADPTLEPAADDNPQSELERSRTIDAVRRAVLALPPHYREVVVLCKLHEMDYQEAAEALGCAVGTVRSRLHRAMGLLPGKLAAAKCAI